MSKALIVDALSVAYHGNPVLREVTAVAEPGKVLAVTGPSGAGKTTLLWAMAGLVPASGGTVSVDNERLRDRYHAVESGIVLIPQDNGLASILTAEENVLAALLGAGGGIDEVPARTAQALDRLGLSGQAGQLVEELSGGQQQRTAIARGLAMRAEVLLADEVTSELDAQNRQLVLELLHEEAWRGAAVVFATHDPEAAESCDLELHLLDGQAELVRG